MNVRYPPARTPVVGRTESIGASRRMTASCANGPLEQLACHTLDGRYAPGLTRKRRSGHHLWALERHDLLITEPRPQRRALSQQDLVDRARSMRTCRCICMKNGNWLRGKSPRIGCCISIRSRPPRCSWRACGHTGLTRPIRICTRSPLSPMSPTGGGGHRSQPVHHRDSAAKRGGLVGASRSREVEARGHPQ
jgi:hypothetical protein